MGGSAGDDLRFERTYVYHEGAFVSNAAVFAVVSRTGEISFETEIGRGTTFIVRLSLRPEPSP